MPTANLPELEKEYWECLLKVAHLDCQHPDYEKHFLKAIRLKRDIEKSERHPTARWRNWFRDG